MITVTNTNHTHAQEYASYGGVGGYSFQPETTVVEWSDGTRLIVEGHTATATYRGTSYRLRNIGTTLHDAVVEHWIERISIRLQQDVAPSTRLQDRLRNWNTDTTRAA